MRIDNHVCRSSETNSFPNCGKALYWTNDKIFRIQHGPLDCGCKLASHLHTSTNGKSESERLVT